MSESSAGLVPELYYDVIARLCAGAPFVGYVIFRTESLEDVEAVKLAVVGALASYLLGHFLGTISAGLNWLIWRPCLLKRVIRRIPLDHPFSEDSFRDGFHELYKRIDVIGRRDPNGGALLKKMEAGAALSDNLLAGVLLFGPAALVENSWRIWQALLVVLLIAAILVSTVILRRMVLIGRQDTLWSASLQSTSDQKVGS